ncbi:Protein of unknown function (DUF3263) [Parafrankia irregularis]|uniref:DUF3263 domain-containing protein n=1 Tax=Parafrankia irregularis TaxID=795642 RepID=A0A0S4QTK6_9ACTN|nr:MULTISPECIES: DUF3263 domain-containing protein [Parafrankia]MBE3204460.1 DUF3263 domain-containing protein [Parafrankia sp. CH37]CUU57734.1 Protein of unknown function (DUF3263) [Parafrankia irregularis]
MPPAPGSDAADSGPAVGGGSLSERDARMLAFEKKWPVHTGPKDAAIQAEFGLSSTRYYQKLHVLIESPAALAAEPMLVNRLQRLLDERRRARAGALDDAGAPGGDDPDDA